MNDLVKAWKIRKAMRQRASAVGLGLLHDLLCVSIPVLIVLYAFALTRSILMLNESQISASAIILPFLPVILAIVCSLGLVKLDKDINKRIFFKRLPEDERNHHTCIYLRSFQIDLLEKLRFIESTHRSALDSATHNDLFLLSFGSERMMGSIDTAPENDVWFEKLQIIAASAALVLVCPIATPATLAEINFITRCRLDDTLFIMPKTKRRAGPKFDLMLTASNVVFKFLSMLVISFISRKNPITKDIFTVQLRSPTLQLWEWSRRELIKSNIYLPEYDKSGRVFRLHMNESGQFTEAFNWDYNEMETALSQVLRTRSRRPDHWQMGRRHDAHQLGGDIP